jgi:hypothetical protein
MKKSLLLLLFVAVSVCAEEPVLEDFAYGIELITDNSAPIYRLPIPQQVYQKIYRRDLGDIRIFNSNGQRIPYAIRVQKSRETTRSYWVNLPVFPLKGNPERLSRMDNIEIRVNDNGKIVDIHYQDESGQDDPIIPSYIIDLSGVKQNIDELVFDISNEAGSYLKSVFIEKSEDLNTWSMLVSNASLSRLQYGSHTLEKNNINIPGQRTNYLRFTWRDNSENLQVKSVRALLTTTGSKFDQERQWSAVTGIQSEDDRNKYEFDLGGIYPVDKVNVLLPDKNILIEASLRSRNDPNSTWDTHYTGLFYKMEMQDTLIEQQAIPLRTTTARYWQLDVKTDDGIGYGLPQLKFAWVPNEIYFLARGSGPYILAYGNSQVQAPEKPINALMQVLSNEQQQSMIQPAGYGKTITYKGDAALIPIKEIPWRQILLWIIMVSAVITIAVIARKLYREMDKTRIP